MIRRRVETFEYDCKTITVTETHAQHVVRLLTGFWLVMPLWFASVGVFLYTVHGAWFLLGLLWLPALWLYMWWSD